MAQSPMYPLFRGFTLVFQRYRYNFFTVLVSVTAGGNPTLGQRYILTCNVSVASGVNGTPTVQWVGPGNSAPIVTGGDFTVGSTSPYTLTINPLRQSHAGQYTCQATVGGDIGTESVIVDIPGTCGYVMCKACHQ